MSFNLDEILGQVKQVEETKTQKEKGGFKGDPRLLTLKKGCTYTLRLIPNLKDVNNTFVTFKEIGFKSRVDNSYVYGGRSPQDAGLKSDPFKETQWNHYNKAKERGDEVEQKASYKLLPQRKQVVNAYLIAVDGDDAEAKEKVGTVVVVKYPAQLNKDNQPVSDIFGLIFNAIMGDMTKKIGTKAFDLTEKGKSLVIKVTDKAGFNNYAKSYFDDAEEIPGMDKEKIVKIMNSAHDLNEFIPEVKAEADIRDILNKHWFGDDASSEDALDESEKPESNNKIDLSSSDDDQIPMDSKSESDDDLDELLKD